MINENFATMADVHRILGTLPAGVDHMATVDGREKTVEASRARLARMVASDADEADEATWTLLARWFAEAQLRAIADAAALVMSRGALASGAPIIAAGIGLSARGGDRPAIGLRLCHLRHVARHRTGGARRSVSLRAGSRARCAIFVICY